jgi:hypothetical protein
MHFKELQSQVWWCTSIIPALRRLWQEDHEFQASLDPGERERERERKRGRKGEGEEEKGREEERRRVKRKRKKN